MYENKSAKNGPLLVGLATGSTILNIRMHYRHKSWEMLATEKARSTRNWRNGPFVEFC